MNASLELVGGWHDGPLFIPIKRRALVRPKGKEGQVRRAQEKRATPAWANRAQIRAVYSEAKRLTRETGVLHVVDHIVPLIGKLGGVQIVSGLHIHWNMRVIQWRENSIKGAFFWPDMPFEQIALPL